MMSTLESLRCSIIHLPRIGDYRGNLSFIEGGRHIPFDIRRVYYIYDVPAGESRGGHAHRQVHQVMLALSGSFDILLDNGIEKTKITLNTPYIGLYIPNLVWREIVNFSTGAVLMVLASEYYDENDYIRDYREFRNSVL